MIRSRLAINSGKLVKKSIPAASARMTASKKAVTANGMFPGVGGSGSPTSVMAFGGPVHNTTFLGIIPEYNENMLLTYYRDCYYYDSIAGSTVDILSTFPFSDWTLTGIENKHISKYSESMARINVRTMMQEASLSYLVDGAFIGSLVYDSDGKSFQDLLMHDVANANISQQPFYALDPVISVNSTNVLSEYLNSGSPYVEQIMRSYPKRMLETFMRGSVMLDPMTTLYMPRKALRDRTHASYLKRLLPVYLLEKLLYRGTLTEASKRLRATTHIMAGDDTWEPNPAEMATILSDFQRSEMDPLGAWIITRQGVQVNEVRPGGDFWKWTDNIDTLTPFKLRALGVSEAFLSGDASYATAEAAIQIFMDNTDAFREHATHTLFTNKMFPLIAVIHGLYKDPKEARKLRSPADLQFNLNNHKNLLIPQVRWHKSLGGKNDDGEFDMLDKLSEKGFVIPLKMWASAAGVDITMMLRDLEEDQKIKEEIEKVTGVKAEDQGLDADVEGGDVDEGDQDLRFSAMTDKHYPGARGTMPMSFGTSRRKIPMLSRQFQDVHAKTSKSGNHVHAVLDVSAKRMDGKMKDLIVRAKRALADPNHREEIRKRVFAKLGSKTNLGIV